MLHTDPASRTEVPRCIIRSPCLRHAGRILHCVRHRALRFLCWVVKSVRKSSGTTSEYFKYSTWTRGFVLTDQALQTRT